MFKYLPHTETDQREILDILHLESLQDLYRDIPKDVLFSREFQLPEAHSELEVRSFFEHLGSKNTALTCFAGAGFYDHYEPSVIKQIVSRQEFLTSYTPYQPEVSQGTLQYIFEYQSMIQTLTGMDTSNASMYDGLTATAEAMFMAEAITKRKKILIAGNVHPSMLEVVQTYAHYKGLGVDVVHTNQGLVDTFDLKELLTTEIAALIVQKPNYFGLIEDFSTIATLLHEKGALLIENADISTLAVLKSPREDGADIAVGDCQSLGMPLSYGGPTLGYMATTKQYVRKMPGRICGLSYDQQGRRAFVLTLQAREQHIRRDKANSNICSNQSLMALYATVYLSIMGPEGLKQVNDLSYQRAHLLYDKLLATGKFHPVFDAPFLKEFTVETLIPHALIREALENHGFFGALSLASLGEAYENYVTFAVTEKRTVEEIDRLVSVLEGLSW